MSLSLFALLLCTQPAQAQGPGGYPGGPGWSVTDQAGNPIPANGDGSGYPLKGTLTGSCTFTGAYQDALAAGQKPNAPIGYPFNPNPANYQGWLFKGGASSPDDTYNPYAVWTMVSASNCATNTWGGGLTGYLSDYGNENINGSLTVNVGGTLWAIFQSSDPPHAPDHINVLLSTSVSADVSSNTFGGPPQGGLTGSVTATDSTFSETASAPGGVSQVTGRHLLRVAVDPKTGQAPVSLGGNVKATASNSVAYGEFGYLPGTMYYGYSQTNGSAAANASGAISATAQIDSRDLTLYRDGAKPGFIGNDGLQHGDWTDSSGTTHGETTYSYRVDQNPTINKQFLHPRFVGSWNLPPASWQWDTYSQVPRQWDSAEYDILLGNVSYVNGDAVGTVDAPYTYNLSYTATDSDGATATANYVLTAHYQWENKRLDPANPFDVIDHDDLVSVNGQIYPAQENDDYTERQPVGALTIGFNLTLALSAQLNGSFKISDFFTLGGNFQPSISISGSVSQAVVGDEIPPRCYIQLKWHTHYHKNHWLTDHYTPAGFDASYLQLIDGDVTYNSLHWGHPIRLDDSGLGGH